MDNYDKLFNQIKEASEKTEVGDFPAMDKVWSRVEEKLDKKVLKKENKRWKKLAIAASVLLITTIGYHVYNTENKIITEDVNIVAIDSVATNADNVVIVEGQDSAHQKITNPKIKPDAEQLLRKQVVSTAVASSDIVSGNIANEAVSVSNDSTNKNRKSFGYSRNSKGLMKKEIFEARSVERYESDVVSKKMEAKQVVGKASPLVVIDGKAVKVDAESEDGGMSKIDPDNLEDIVVLKEPLYIINGHYYSELELFGPNPTSPYAPLNQQEIETLSILQGEKAIANYGKRGEKGVVIITTKDGKPVKAAGKKGN